jgi:hypothetical protein
MTKSTLNLTLTTLTPLAIADRELAPLSETRDYLYDATNHEICFLDQNALKRILEEKDKTADFKRKSRNAHPEYSLRHYLHEQLGLDEFEIDGLIRSRRPAHGFRPNTLDRIMPGCQSAGAPILPAGHLAEAVRAATLYDWLSSEKESSGKDHPTRWAEGIGEAYQACQPFFQELRILQESYRKRPDRFGSHSKARMDELQAEVAKQLGEKLGMNEEILFGEGGSEKIQSTTAAAFPEQSWEVQALGKIDIEKGDLSRILLHSSIAAGAETQASLDIHAGLDHPHLKGWQEDPAKELTGILYDFAYDLVEFEREILDELIQENRFGEGGERRLFPAQRQNLELLRNAYDNFLEEELEEAGEDITYLRLSREGGYLTQVLSLILFQTDEVAYNQYQLLSGFLSGQGPIDMFQTEVSLQLGRKRGRRQEAEILQPMGWVKCVVG